MLSDPETHCVAICTENRDHASRVEACLRAGKHVLVEYPLASTGAEADALLRLASRVDRVLHVGLIGLLTGQHEAVAKVVETQAVYGIELALTGGFGGWIADEARAGRYGQLAVSRLHALWDWVGPLSLHRARCDRRADGYALHLEIRDERGRIHRLVERRGVDARREKSVVVRDPRGVALEVGEAAKLRGVFVQDTAHFHARLQGTSPRVADDVVVAVAGLAEAVSLRVGSPC